MHLLPSRAVVRRWATLAVAVVALSVAGVLSACGSSPASTGSGPTHAAAPRALGSLPLNGDRADPAASPPPAAPVPAPATAQQADLHNVGESPIHYRLVAPTGGIDVGLYAVGLTRAGAMDAPEGPPGSAFWTQGFWYRGDVLPGQNGTAALAGHVDDTLGRPAAFWNLKNIHTGDPMQIVDDRGQVIHYRVVDVVNYSVAQANTPAVLTRLFGADAVAGRAPGTTPDTVGRLTLITCAGTFRSGEYDHRLAVFAERTDPAPA